jgi:asparagine synthase (glutamine-hydrolysing)
MTAIAALANDHRFGRGEHGRTLWQLMMLERAMKRVFG